MKIKLFTHNDLDGVGAGVVAKHAFGENVDVEYCGYDSIDSKVAEFLISPEFDETDAIFITDISVKEEALIKLINYKAKDKLMLIDHHKTAEHLNQYSWAKVSDTEVNYKNNDASPRLSSGTSAFYFYLVESGLLEPTPELRDFVEQVRSWDTWDWTRTNPRNEQAMLLNLLLTVIGRWKFVERFSANAEVVFNATERTIVDIEKNRIDYTIKTKQKALIERELVLPIGVYKVGVVFAENYVSDVGNALAESNPHLDFIITVINGNKLSFRGIEKGIDLGLVAKEFGGGGHPLAAGASLEEDTLNKVFDLILNKE